MNDNKLATPQLCRGIRLASETFRRWPWILLVLVLLPFGLIAAAASLNYSGFCIGQRRFLPDDVFLRTAIEDTILLDAALPISVGYRDSKEQFVKSIPYRGLSDFQARNPRCCEILTKLPLEYPEISAIDRFLGAASKTVAVTYFRQHRDDDGSIATRTKTSYVTIGNCGAVFNIGR